MLYQFPVYYLSVFNSTLGQNDIPAISYFTSSENIIHQGGLKEIYSEPDIYTISEIEEQLNKLSILLEDHGSTEKVGIVLGGHGHTIGLLYEKGLGFKFMDINLYPSKVFGKKTNAIAMQIAMSLGTLSFSDEFFTAFNLSVVGLGNDPTLSILKEKLQFLKRPLNQEIVLRKTIDGRTLAYLLAQHGKPEAIREAHKLGADLNAELNKGETPIIASAQNNYSDVLKVLGQLKADINKATKNGETALYSAASLGFNEIIDALCDLGAEVNQARLDGATPLYVAANQNNSTSNSIENSLNLQPF